MHFTTKKQWQDYLLSSLTGDYGGYAVVKWEEKEALLYFAKHSYKGEPWLLEGYNDVRRVNIESEVDQEMLKEHGYIIRGKYAYDIDTPQSPPFLPDELEIITLINSNENKALDYLLENKF